MSTPTNEQQELLKKEQEEQKLAEQQAKERYIVHLQKLIECRTEKDILAVLKVKNKTQVKSFASLVAIKDSKIVDVLYTYDDDSSKLTYTLQESTGGKTQTREEKNVKALLYRYDSKFDELIHVVAITSKGKTSVPVLSFASIATIKEHLRLTDIIVKAKNEGDSLDFTRISFFNEASSTGTAVSTPEISQEELSVLESLLE